MAAYPPYPPHPLVMGVKPRREDEEDVRGQVGQVEGVVGEPDELLHGGDEAPLVRPPTGEFLRLYHKKKV